jgi:hypothetical protein
MSFAVVWAASLTVGFPPLRLYEFFTNLLLHPYESSLNLGHVDARLGTNVRMGTWQLRENNLYMTARRRVVGRSN